MDTITLRNTKGRRVKIPEKGLRLSFGRDRLVDHQREVSWIRGSISFNTREEAKFYLFEHIEIFFNRQRHQTRPGRRRLHIHIMKTELCVHESGAGSWGSRGH